MGARHLFERPSAVAVYAAFVCLPGGFQCGVLVVAVDADAEQAAVGQHFAHVDVVAALPKPQAAAAQTHSLLYGMQAQPLGTLFHIGGNPFAQSHAEQPSQQAY